MLSLLHGINYKIGNTTIHTQVHQKPSHPIRIVGSRSSLSPSSFSSTVQLAAPKNQPIIYKLIPRITSELVLFTFPSEPPRASDRPTNARPATTARIDKIWCLKSLAFKNIIARRAAKTTTEERSIQETLGAIILFETFLQTCSKISKTDGIDNSNAGLGGFGFCILLLPYTAESSYPKTRLSSSLV